MQKSLTPWPIETHSHPLSSLHVQREANGPVLDYIEGMGAETETVVDDNRKDWAILSKLVASTDPESLGHEALSQLCFTYPQIFRDSILRHVRVESRESFRGKGTFYVWLNKSCPVGCDFCFFKSPSKAQTEIPSGDEGIGKLITFINDAGMERLFLSGGGEPMMKSPDVNRIAREVDVDKIVLVTSAFFALKDTVAYKRVMDLRDSLDANPHSPVMTLRLSLDSGHLEKLGAKSNGGLRYVHNLIAAIRDTSPSENDKISFLIHTMMGDKTVEKLLGELTIKSRVDSGSEFRRRTHLVLEDGFEFDVEYSQLFCADTNVDMNGHEATHNIHAFEDYVEHRANGNMTLSHNAHADDDQVVAKGVDWLTLYDGTVTHWSSTVPDNEPSIYSDTFEGAMQRHMNDVIALALLENGTFYRDNIVAEASPKAVERARAIGLRDQYPRVLMEEEKIRLYASLRIIQDFIKDGRITEAQMVEWPPVLRALVNTPQPVLVQACKESNHDILAQYLVNPNLEFDHLTKLYKMVRLGHYDITPVEMLKRILTSDISYTIKYQFTCDTWSCKYVQPLVSKFSSPDEMIAAVAA